jgi:hypothetical protein
VGEGSAADDGELRETWLHLGELLGNGSAPAADEAIVARLQEEFTRERRLVRRKRWGRIARLGIGLASLSAAIVGAVYLSPAWEVKQTETDLAWDEPLDAVIAQIERTTEAWPGPGDVSTEFDVIDSDIAWIDSLGNEDSF